MDLCLCGSLEQVVCCQRGCSPFSVFSTELLILPNECTSHRPSHRPSHPCTQQASATEGWVLDAFMCSQELLRKRDCRCVWLMQASCLLCARWALKALVTGSPWVCAMQGTLHLKDGMLRIRCRDSAPRQMYGRWLCWLLSVWASVCLTQSVLPRTSSERRFFHDQGITRSQTSCSTIAKHLDASRVWLPSWRRRWMLTLRSGRTPS